jgi:chaperonin cofactor prefoldin
MSGTDLGGGRCQQCGGPITGKGRRDRKYCSASCRTVAWSERAGKDASKASSQASTAKLDDRTVDRLADALALRFVYGETVPAARRPEPQPVAATPVVSSEFEAIKQLQAEMAKLRTDLELSRASPSTTPGSQRATAVLRRVEEGKLSPPSHPPTTGQPRAAKRLADGQAGGDTVAASTAQFEQLKATHRQELAAIDKDHEQLTRKFSALFLAHNKLETALENAATEKQSLSKRIRDLERQCEAAKAETESIRKQLQSLR